MNKVLSRIRAPITAVIFCLLAATIVLFARETGMLQWIELLAYDLLIRTTKNDAPKEKRIVIMGATESDLNQFGWPLTDLTLANIISKIIALRPRVVGVDLYRDQTVPPGHKALSKVLKSNNHIIWVSKFGDGRTQGVPPPQVLEGSDRHGFADVVQDRDGVIRRGLLFLDDGKTASYGFALRLSLEYLAAEGVRPQSGKNSNLRLGKVEFKPIERGYGAYVDLDARGYQLMLDYAIGRRPFKIISLRKFIEGEVAPESIQDKIVVIGITANSVKDYFYTPFSRSDDIDQTTFGVIVQAQVAAQILRHALDGKPTISALDKVGVSLWIFGCALILGLLAVTVRSATPFIISASFLIAIYLIVVYVAFLQSIWLPFVPGLSVMLLSMVLIRVYFARLDRDQRAQLMHLFSRYVSDAVAKDIWQKRDEVLENGRPRTQRQIATVLFSDIKDFTPISERVEPAVLMDWLNEYMDVMVAQVGIRDGVIEKFTGDGITAIFGVPIARTQEAQFKADAISSVECALAMKRELKVLNEHWSKNNKPQIAIRIGINTGDIIVGSLGNVERMQYTAIGDSVNIAARLESLGKEVKGSDSCCQILIGESTANYVKSEFDLQDLGTFKLKGKGQMVRVFRVMGTKQLDDAIRS